jgi:glyceraldehyde 3-phosphate dehydrogenase
MPPVGTPERAIGINGLGRIGKLTVWHHAARKHFSRVVINVGRAVGRGLEAGCSVIEKDATYGSMHRFLFGVDAAPCVRIVDRDQGLLEVASMPVTILQEARNPHDVAWRSHGVRVVVDTTGAFCDPTRPSDDPRGALRGHLEGGAETVLNSAAFKIEDGTAAMPTDAVTLIYGCNHERFDPAQHRLISAASCTTTALAHMLKPLLEHLPASRLLTASMSTVHAATNTQSVLDTVPAAGATDVRRTRSALNSIILTSTNATEALEHVIPQIRDIGFMGDSLRIPLPTESLIILNFTVQARLGTDGSSSVGRHAINEIYRLAAARGQAGDVAYSEEQNVPADVLGRRAAVVIEAAETHTRTGFVDVDLTEIPGLDDEALARFGTTVVRVPVTHAKVFGWYDNEYGSYVNLLGDLTVHVHRSLGV